MKKIRKTKFRIVLTALFVMSAPAFIEAQESGFGYGAILGVGQANIQTSGLASPQPKISFTAGVTTSYKFNRYLGIGLDITGVSKGTKVTGSERSGFPAQTYTYQESYSMIDIDMPLLLRGYIGNDKLSLNVIGGAGMNFNVLAFSNRVYDDVSYDADNGYRQKNLSGINATNLSYTFGLGLTAKAAAGNYYFVQARTTGPLSSMGMLNGSEARHNSLNITFGYLFY